MIESHRPVHRALGLYRNHVLDLLDAAPDAAPPFLLEAIESADKTLRKLLKVFVPPQKPDDAK